MVPGELSHGDQHHSGGQHGNEREHDGTMVMGAMLSFDMMSVSINVDVPSVRVDQHGDPTEPEGTEFQLYAGMGGESTSASTQIGTPSQGRPSSLSGTLESTAPFNNGDEISIKVTWTDGQQTHELSRTTTVDRNTPVQVDLL